MRRKTADQTLKSRSQAKQKIGEKQKIRRQRADHLQNGKSKAKQKIRRKTEDLTQNRSSDAKQKIRRKPSNCLVHMNSKKSDCKIITPFFNLKK
jgi:hypothetical protein